MKELIWERKEPDSPGWYWIRIDGVAKVKQFISSKRQFIKGAWYCKIPEPKIVIRRRSKKSIEFESKHNEDSYLKFFMKSMDKISDLGYPFVKHRKGSKVYNDSLSALRKAYNKYKNDTFDAFRVAAKYFKDPNFIYKPKSISISNFIKYDIDSYMRIPKIQKLKVRSWINEFIKGEEYIEDKYLKVAKDKNEKITGRIISKWKELKQIDHLTIYEKNVLIKFSRKVHLFSFKNNVTQNDIVNIIFNSIRTMDHVSVHFLLTDFVWKDLLPKRLIFNGLIRKWKDLELI